MTKYNFESLYHVAKKIQYSSIHEAVKNDDVVEMQSMVQQGAGLNDVDPKFKFTPLHWAAHQGSLEVYLLMLVKNCYHESMQILKMLVHRG